MKIYAVEHTQEIAVAGRDGNHLDFQRISPERAAKLAGELQEAVGEDQGRLEMTLLRAGGNSEREIADLIGKSPSTVHRTMPTAFQQVRIYVVVALILEWMDTHGGCLISLSTAKTANWNHDGYFVTSLTRRQSMRDYPQREDLIRIIKRERSLVQLAEDLSADNHVPFVACWYDGKRKRWFVDFPLLFSDRAKAVSQARKEGVGSIFHIASSQIEMV